jgi:hypothetical protein
MPMMPRMIYRHWKLARVFISASMSMICSMVLSSSALNCYLNQLQASCICVFVSYFRAIHSAITPLLEHQQISSHGPCSHLTDVNTSFISW